MAIATLRPKCALVRIVFRVAGDAFRFDALEFLVDVAGGALRRLMGAQKRKICFGMIEADCLPVIDVVAGLTIAAEFALVRIVSAMTSEARSRRFAEFLSFVVTILAGDFRMPA